MKWWAVCFFWGLCTVSLCGAVGNPSPVFVPPQVARATMVQPESFRITIENKPLGRVMVSIDQGENWYLIGSVKSPITRLRDIQDAEFTASDWAYVGSVAATAVNAIHIKVAHPAKHARIFSILPVELSDPDGFKTSYRDNPSSIFLDMPGGTGLFSGRWGLRLGDPLWWVTNGKWVPWPEDRVPDVGDVIGITSQKAPDSNWMIEIENLKGGKVWFVTSKNEPLEVAKVVQPFGGSGRFLGTFFQDVGRVRANHPGVIDISTSPLGQQGGIQIVPFYHSKAPNLGYVHSSPAYMVLASLHADTHLEGMGPLFMGYIRPGDRVLAKVAGEWVPFPESIGKNLIGLKQVQAIRIFPEE